MDNKELDKLFAEALAVENAKPEPEFWKELGMVVTERDREEALRRIAKRKATK